MKTSKYLKYYAFIVLCFPIIALGEGSANGSAPWVGGSLAGPVCTGKNQSYGPFDYTNPSNKSNIGVVVTYHFTYDVENLVKGSTGDLYDDLDYTLRAVPNHHKALLSLIRYQLKLDKKQAYRGGPMATPVECYLQRAIHYSPNDAISYSLYAYYLQKVNQLDKAAKIYDKALQISPGNAKIEYSYSLLLIELHEYEKALEYAQKAYAHSNEKAPKGLKNKLIKLGVWKEPSDKG